MTAALEFRKDSVEEFEFSTCSPEEVVTDIVWIHCVLDFFEYEGMIADFLELHHRVIQSAETLSTQLAPCKQLWHTLRHLK